MALRIPIDEKPQRVNFAEACHAICQMEPKIDIRNVSDVLKKAITQKRVSIDGVPDTYSRNLSWAAGLIFSDGRVFSKGGGALFMPTLAPKEVVALFIENESELLAATKRFETTVHVMRGAPLRRSTKSSAAHPSKSVQQSALIKFLNTLPAGTVEKDARDKAKCHFQASMSNPIWRPAWRKFSGKRQRGQTNRAVAAAGRSDK